MEQAEVTSPLRSQAASGVLDKDPSHRFDSGREEMPRTFPPSNLVAVGKTQVSLVDECRRLQRVVGAFDRHSRTGKSPQLKRFCGA